MTFKSVFGFKWQKELDHLAELIHVQQELTLMQAGAFYSDETRRARCYVTLGYGVKFIRVDVGDCGKYMVDAKTGYIYGISGYGRVNHKKVYGTLDTVDQYHWGYYTAIPRDCSLARSGSGWGRETCK